MSSKSHRKRPLMHIQTYFRALISIAVSAGTLYLAAAILPGLYIEDPLRAFVAAIAISVANALLWPLVIRFALPVAVLTLGLAGFVINAALIWVVVNLIDGMDVTAYWVALVVAFMITLTNTIVMSLLGIDDDDFYYRNVI